MGLEFHSFVRDSLVDVYVKIELLSVVLQLFDESPERNKLESVLLWNVVVNGCCKNGILEKVMRFFEAMPERNLGSWNSLINGLMRNGEVVEKNLVSLTTVVHGLWLNGMHEKALEMFFKMIEEGVRGNYLNLVSALNACAKIHWVFHDTEEKDIRTWSFMIWDWAIHQCIQQALQCFEKMKLAEKLLQLEPKHSGSYVFMSNVYAGTGIWEEVERVRTLMKNKGAAKDPGWSYMEVDGKLHSFVAGGQAHRRTQDIYLKLEKNNKLCKRTRLFHQRLSVYFIILKRKRRKMHEEAIVRNWHWVVGSLAQVLGSNLGL